MMPLPFQHGTNPQLAGQVAGPTGVQLAGQVPGVFHPFPYPIYEPSLNGVIPVFYVHGHPNIQRGISTASASNTLTSANDTVKPLNGTLGSGSVVFQSRSTFNDKAKGSTEQSSASSARPQAVLSPRQQAEYTGSRKSTTQKSYNKRREHTDYKRALADKWLALERKRAEQAQRNKQIPKKTLTIPFDPRRWTTKDVHTWLFYTLHMNDIEEVDFSYFVMNGKGLCMLSESAFVYRVPNPPADPGGKTLYRDLRLRLMRCMKAERAQAKTMPTLNRATNLRSQGSDHPFKSVPAALYSRLPPAPHSSRLTPEEHCQRLPLKEHSTRMAPQEHSSRFALVEQPSRLRPAEHSQMLSSADHSSRLPLAGHSLRLTPAVHSPRLPHVEHLSRLPFVEHSSRLPPAEHPSRLPPSGDSSSLPPSGDSLRLTRAEHSSRLISAEHSSRITHSEQSSRLSRAKYHSVVPHAEHSTSLPPAEDSSRLTHAERSLRLASAVHSSSLTQSEQSSRLPHEEQASKWAQLEHSSRMPPAEHSLELTHEERASNLPQEELSSRLLKPLEDRSKPHYFRQPQEFTSVLTSEDRSVSAIAKKRYLRHPTSIYFTNEERRVKSASSQHSKTPITSLSRPLLGIKHGIRSPTSATNDVRVHDSTTSESVRCTTNISPINLQKDSRLPVGISNIENGNPLSDSIPEVKPQSPSARDDYHHTRNHTPSPDAGPSHIESDTEIPHSSSSPDPTPNSTQIDNQNPDKIIIKIEPSDPDEHSPAEECSSSVDCTAERDRKILKNEAFVNKIPRKYQSDVDCKKV